MPALPKRPIETADAITTDTNLTDADMETISTIWTQQGQPLFWSKKNITSMAPRTIKRPDSISVTCLDKCRKNATNRTLPWPQWLMHKVNITEWGSPPSTSVAPDCKPWLLISDCPDSAWIRRFKLVCGQDNTPNLNRPEQTSEMFSDLVNFINDTIDVVNKKLQPY